MKFNIEYILCKIEADWKHVAYDPTSNKIYLLSDCYRCLDTKSDWFDFQDGRTETGVRMNNRRIRTSKTKHWAYLGTK